MGRSNVLSTLTRAAKRRKLRPACFPLPPRSPRLSLWGTDYTPRLPGFVITFATTKVPIRYDPGYNILLTRLNNHSLMFSYQAQLQKKEKKTQILKSSSTENHIRSSSAWAKSLVPADKPPHWNGRLCTPPDQHAVNYVLQAIGRPHGMTSISPSPTIVRQILPESPVPISHRTRTRFSHRPIPVSPPAPIFVFFCLSTACMRRLAISTRLVTVQYPLVKLSTRLPHQLRAQMLLRLTGA